MLKRNVNVEFRKTAIKSVHWKRCEMFSSRRVRLSRINSSSCVRHFITYDLARFVPSGLAQRKCRSQCHTRCARIETIPHAAAGSFIRSSIGANFVTDSCHSPAHVVVCWHDERLPDCDVFARMEWERSQPAFTSCQPWRNGNLRHCFVWLDNFAPWAAV